MTENTKNYYFMFCYTWFANSQSGNGYKVLANDREVLTMKDIDESIEIIKKTIETTMSHNSSAVKIIFTSIIKLNHCTHDEFYNSK